MTRLYVFPSWLLLVAACALAIYLAAGLQTLVHRRFRQTDFLQHNEVGGFTVSVVGTLYAVILAFVVSIVWQEYDGSSARCYSETANAATAWQIALGLPEPVGGRTRAEIVEYARIMINEEWPAMRSGKASSSGEQTVTNLLHQLAIFRPTNAGEATLQSQVLQSLEAVHDLRHERLADNATGLSAFQWTILLLGASLVVGFCFLFGLTNQSIHNLMTSAVACLIAAAFVLIFELDYPFHGDLGISPESWKTFLTSIGTTW